MLLRLVLLLYELLLSSNITSKEKLNQLKKLQQEQQNYKKTRGEAKKEPKGSDKTSSSTELDIDAAGWSFP